MPGYLHGGLTEQVDDIMQTAFLALHNNTVPLPRGFIVKGRLFQIAFADANDMIRKSTAQRRFTGVATATIDGMDRQHEEPDPAEAAATREIVSHVNALVDALDEPERTVVRMSLDGFSRRDGAKELGITDSAFQYRLAHGLSALRKAGGPNLVAALQ